MSKSIVLPENSKLTPDIINELDSLLDFSPPEAFRKSILKVYLQYIINEHEALPNDFENVACDFSMLIDFFTMAEELMRNNRT